MSDRLREIAERDELSAWERTVIPGSIEATISAAMEIANRRCFMHNALAYCDRILAHNPSGAELMFLTELKRILTGESDGRQTTEANDAK